MHGVCALIIPHRVRVWLCKKVRSLLCIGQWATILPSRSVVHCSISVDKFRGFGWSILIVHQSEGDRRY